MPKVSVNIPCYNGEKFIAKTIQSVLNQTFSDFEIVIINDGSSDRTEEIVRKFTDPRIKYFSQVNHGLAYTRNRAVSLSSGEFIGLLDQDDAWLPQKLERQIELFDRNPTLGLVYSESYLVYPEGMKVLASRFFNYRRGYVFKEMLSDYFIVVSTAIVRKSVVDEFGGFPNYRIAEEFALFLKIAEKYPIDFVHEPLVEYLYHEANTSRHLEVNLREVEEIYGYWSEKGDDEIRNICKISLGKHHYGLGRRALFHLNDKTQAKHYIKGSFQYQRKFKYFAFWVFCFFPIWLIQGVRKFLLSMSSK